jgi:heme oxygenase
MMAETRPRPESLRYFLKRETAIAHDNLDASFALYALDSRAGYVGFVIAHLIAWRALARHWTDALATLIAADAPDYAAMLEADLRDIVDGTVPDLPDLPNLPGLSVETPASAAGLAYVLAGSRLGVTVIARQPTWGHVHGRGTRFMDDRQGTIIFRQLIAFFDSPAGLALDRAAALRSAREGFDAFAQAAEKARTASA